MSSETVLDIAFESEDFTDIYPRFTAFQLNHWGSSTISELALLLTVDIQLFLVLRAAD